MAGLYSFVDVAKKFRAVTYILVLIGGYKNDNIIYFTKKKKITIIMGNNLVQ